MKNWKDRLLIDGKAVAWLSLDDEDNDPDLLTSYIAFSLLESGVGEGFFSRSDGESFDNLSTRQQLASIVSAIESFGSDVVLILDDFENLESPVVEQIIMPLIHYAADNFKIAIAGRETDFLRISGFQAAGLVDEHFYDDLKFTIDDLSKIINTSLSNHELQDVFKLTEGWPVMVQMVNNELSKGVQLNSIIEGSSSYKGTIFNYLSEHVFDSLDNSVQDLLIDISVVERVDIEYLKHLYDFHPPATLQEVSTSLGTLLLPTEGLDGVFRFHPLFKSFLYKKARESYSHRLPELHRKTSLWYSELGNIVRAVKHAVYSQDIELAVQVIERAGGIQLWLREGVARLREIANIFNEYGFPNQPRVNIIVNLVRLKDGHIYKARQSFDDMRHKFEREKATFSNLEKDTIEREIFLLETLLSFYEGKVLTKFDCDNLSKSIDDLEKDDHEALAYHYNLLCAANANRGSFSVAINYGLAAITEYRNFSSAYGEAYIHLHLVDIYFAMGEPDKAKDHYESSTTIIKRKFADDKGLRLIASAFKCELDYEMGLSNVISPSIQKLPQQLESREAWFDVYAAGYITASNLEFLHLGKDAALRILETAEKYARSENMTRLSGLLKYQKLYILIRSNRNARSELDISDFNLENFARFGTEYAWRELDTAVFAVSYLHIRELDFNSALKILDKFSPQAESKGNIRSTIRYLLLSAIAKNGLKQISGAVNDLGQTLTLVKKTGYLRAIIEYARDVNQLKFALGDRISSESIEFLRQVLQSEQDNQDCETNSNPMSKREMEILNQLANGHSNKIIARQLGISDNTVRFHLKNIFIKLKVNNRVQAVTISKKLGFIQD